MKAADIPPNAADFVAARTSRDTLLGGRVTIVQPLEGYRAAIDPILLAAATQAEPGEVVLDAGCGVGAAGLCLAARHPDITVIGVERQQDYAAWGREGAALSRLDHRITIVTGCITCPPAPVVPGTIDRIVTNPPYNMRGKGRSPRNDRAMAMAESDLDLASWIGAVHRLLAPRGRLSLIHRADRLDDIILALKPRFGALCIKPIHSHAGSPARRVIVHARRDVRTPITVEAGLVVHEADGAFTPQALRILNDAEGF